MPRNTILLVVGCLVMIGAGSASAESPQEALESITAAEMRDHVYFLASDFVNGRAPGLAGYEIAANYCTSQFIHAGLDSAIVLPDGTKTYFQEISTCKRKLATCTIEVRSSAGTQAFEIGQDFKVFLFDYSRNEDLVVDAVFAGFGISEPDHGWDDFEGLDLEGKVVIVLRGAPTRDGEPVLPQELHDSYAGPRGTVPKMNGLVEHKPALVLIEASDRYLKQWERRANDGFWPTVVTDEEEGLYYHFLDMSIPRFNLVGIPILNVKHNVIEAIVGAEGYRAFDPDSTVAQDDYRTFDIDDIEVRVSQTYNEEPITTWNVVASLEGSDPEVKDEYVMIGAHLDHFPPRGGQVMNGADDNASGCAGVIEIAEALAMAKPRRSVLFALFTSEEVGLLGSRYLARHLPVPAEKIRTFINMDMIGRTLDEVKDIRGIYVSIGHNLCEAPLNLLEGSNDPSFGAGLKLHEDNEAFQRTDQRFFFEEGIPTVGISTGMHADYHRPTDDVDKVDYDKARDVSRLICSYVLRLCNTDEPICDEERRKMGR